MIYYSLVGPCGLVESIPSTENIVTAVIFKNVFSLNIAGEKVYESSKGEPTDKKVKGILKESELYKIWVEVSKTGVIPDFTATTSLPYYVDESGEFPVFIQRFTELPTKRNDPGIYPKPVSLNFGNLPDSYLEMVKPAKSRPVRYYRPESTDILYEALYFDVVISAFHPDVLRQSFGR